jgi:hypothetical protein
MNAQSDSFTVGQICTIAVERQMWFILQATSVLDFMQVRNRPPDTFLFWKTVIWIYFLIKSDREYWVNQSYKTRDVNGNAYFVKTSN